MKTKKLMKALSADDLKNVNAGCYNCLPRPDGSGCTGPVLPIPWPNKPIFGGDIIIH